MSDAQSLSHGRDGEDSVPAVAVDVTQLTEDQRKRLEPFIESNCAEIERLRSLLRQALDLADQWTVEIGATDAERRYAAEVERIRREGQL